MDLSSLTEAGEYEVAVVVVPEDEAIYLRSRATVKYAVESGTGGGDDNPVNPGGDEDQGCEAASPQSAACLPPRRSAERRSS